MKNPRILGTPRTILVQHPCSWPGPSSKRKAPRWSALTGYATRQRTQACSFDSCPPVGSLKSQQEVSDVLMISMDNPKDMVWSLSLTTHRLLETERLDLGLKPTKKAPTNNALFSC